jgi:hypothetical protein
MVDTYQKDLEPHVDLATTAMEAAASVADLAPARNLAVWMLKGVAYKSAGRF